MNQHRYFFSAISFRLEWQGLDPAEILIMFCGIFWYSILNGSIGGVFTVLLSANTAFDGLIHLKLGSLKEGTHLVCCTTWLNCQKDAENMIQNMGSKVL
jgi:hypothetical protein